MIYLEDFLWGFSIISLALYFLQSLRKAISMAPLCIINPPSPSPSSSNSSLPSPLSWVSKFEENYKNNNNNNNFPEESRKGFLENQVVVEGGEKRLMQENMNFEAYQKGLHDNKELNYLGMGKGVKLKKRPARLVLPEYFPTMEFGEKERKLENKEFEIKGKDFCLASKKGRRQFMEDGYGFIIDILGDAKQAFFTVIDGHGGRAAADYVAKNLGKNIIKLAQENDGKEEEDDHCQLEQAIKRGYLVTDGEFLSQGVNSGACAASVLIKNGEIHVANVGDCRVVLSRKGVAETLTMDHRLTRQDERLRIENSGGFVNCRNGIWRVQGSLAISRAIGDSHLKDWIISEPEIKSLQLTSDCDFLIMASDGLWDKVDVQEAVDVILEDKNSIESCKRLVDMSFSRDNMDDITVMVINLQNFILN